MYSAQSNPYKQYKTQSIMTMTKGEMLTQLFDGAIKNLSAAIVAVESKDYQTANEKFQKAQRIVNYLRETLDKSYQVSEGLSALYEFFIHQIIRSNVRKDTGPVKEIIPMLTELRDTFITADKATRARS